VRVDGLAGMLVADSGEGLDLDVAPLHKVSFWLWMSVLRRVTYPEQRE
jgi:hypothetical protein